MTTSGRLMDRIAALRKDIMQGIGIELLKKAYASLDNEDQDLVEVSKQFVTYTKIYVVSLLCGLIT